MRGTWGHHEPRRLMSLTTQNNPYRWNRKALKLGQPWRVFCSSMSDWADAEVPRQWIVDLFQVIRETPALTWMLLTKRHARIAELLPPDFEQDFPHVWLGVSVEDQKRANLRLPAMRALRRKYPATILWVSYEPALGPVDWSGWEGVADWVIFGGESGKQARPCDWAWCDKTLAWCRQHGAAPFVKQSGAVLARLLGYSGKGEDPAEWPANLRVREFPAPRGAHGGNETDAIGADLRAGGADHRLL